MSPGSVPPAQLEEVDLGGASAHEPDDDEAAIDREHPDVAGEVRRADDVEDRGEVHRFAAPIRRREHAERASTEQGIAGCAPAAELHVFKVLPEGRMSDLLAALANCGAQVLDLEMLACHRGSVLGGLPDAPQPTQKWFDSQLWNALRRFDPARPVWVESESRKIGVLHLPAGEGMGGRGAHRLNRSESVSVTTA